MSPASHELSAVPCEEQEHQAVFSIMAACSSLEPDTNSAPAGFLSISQAENDLCCSTTAVSTPPDGSPPSNRGADDGTDGIHAQAVDPAADPAQRLTIRTLGRGRDVTYDDGVAIVGLSCRTAGGNNTPEALWQYLIEQRDASGTIPSWRWEPWLRRDQRNAKEVARTISRGCFIPDLENFDAAFFGISPKEAEQMDPHQRLALELSWEALEDAGLDPKKLAGSDTAVYLGVDTDDYSRLLLEDLPNVEAWMGIGTAPHGVANRVSYHLDLMGPSAAIDAACASSLAAVHMGRQAILNGESEVAIVGGVHVVLAPALSLMLSKAGALSPDGVCRSFDDAANGYARGEGGAVIVLKRHSTALADGDNIWATLEGSALAQDGKTNGIMAPNAKAQELVARQALARAGIDARTVGYVEAHATATPLGDPTEMAAMAAVYGHGAGRSVQDPVYIGSAKPNIGHLEAAAGAIGLVKAALSVRKGLLAPQAHLEKLTTRVDWDSSGLRVVRKTTRWTGSGGPRRAAVCSYGYGGTVSHVVIQEAVGTTARPDSTEQAGPIILTLSSFQKKRLPRQAAALATWLLSPAGKASDLMAIANTLAQRRAHHDDRVAFLVTSHEEAGSALNEFAKGCASAADDVEQARALDLLSRRPVWVFSGHGAQWKDMGKELLQNVVFRTAIAELDGLFSKEAGFSVAEVLASGDFETSERVQILTYTVQIGLARVLKASGIQPAAVMGHSVGEIAAAVVAGCLSAEEGALIVTRRATLYAKMRDRCAGAMALVSLPFAQVNAELGGSRNLVAAIDSSPSTCVVSGEAAALECYVDLLKARRVKTFRVETDMAFHSPMLDELVGPLKVLLNASLRPRQATIPIYSTSSRDARTTQLRNVDYWVANMTGPVQLKAAVNAAADDGYRVFLEVSTHPIVSHSVHETLLERGLDESEFATIATLRRSKSATRSIQNAVAQLWVRGSPVDFAAQLGHRSHWCQDVPRTPWEHRPYYKSVETGSTGGAATHDVERHTILGRRVAVAGNKTVVFTTRLDDKNKPYPLTHPLDGTEIIPAGVYINSFYHATGATVLSHIELRVPLSVGPETRHVQVVVQGDSILVASTAAEALVGTEEAAGWLTHGSCHWAAEPVTPGSSTLDVQAVRKRIGTRLPDNFAVDCLSKMGVAGIAFPWQVVEHYGNSAEMLAKVDMNPGANEMPWDAHSWAPLLDAATSFGSTIFFSEPKLRIVSHIDRVQLYSRGPLPRVGFLHVEAATDARSLASHVAVLAEDGRVLAEIRSMRFSEVEGASGLGGGMESLVHRMDWVPPKFAERGRPLDHVALVSQDARILSQYAQQLQSRASNVFVVGDAAGLSASTQALSGLAKKGSAIVYIPGPAPSLDQVASTAESFLWEVTSLVKMIVNTPDIASSCKLFVVANREAATDSANEAATKAATESATQLAQGALYGLARIIAAEHPDIWGALIDNDSPATFPFLAVRYVDSADVLRVVDGLPRRPILRPLSRQQRYASDNKTKTLLPRPGGTYIITGGLGDLGLETASFLVSKGARRLVLLSRSGLPPRRTWSTQTDARTAAVIRCLQALEESGATVHAIALDISAPNAHTALLDTLDALSLPSVLGVVHAAGVFDNSLVLNTTREFYARVLAPKIRGALALHKAFPPGSLDFFVLYSSTGQLVGTTGQAAYGSGNAFIDALATQRRALGDNAVAFQWTAWRAMGMAATVQFLDIELRSKGITDITPEQAFRAWEHVDHYDIDNVVVTRCLAVESGECAALPLLDDVVVRKPGYGNAGAGASANSGSETTSKADTRPTDRAELEKWLGVKIRECIAGVLMMGDIEDVDPRATMTELGVDSVMTVALRQKLQGETKVKVPPTLTWNHPTVNHLVRWFVSKFQEEDHVK